MHSPSYASDNGLTCLVDGADVRLVLDAFHLYPNHRKIAGATIRALSNLCSLSSTHLRAVAVVELPILVDVQQRHASSQSVNLYLRIEIMEITFF